MKENGGQWVWRKVWVFTGKMRRSEGAEWKNIEHLWEVCGEFKESKWNGKKLLEESGEELNKMKRLLKIRGWREM